MNSFNSNFNCIGKLYCPQEKIFFSPDQLQKEIEKKVHVLSDAGVKSSCKIMLKMSNSSELAFYILACLKMELTIIPVSPSSKDLDWIIDITQSNFIIENENIIKTKFPIGEKSAEAFILFTSGSTGKPKGVPISYNALAKKFEIFAKHLPDEDLKKAMCLLPLYFGHGLIGNFLYPLLTGKDVHLINSGDLSFFATFSEYLQKEGITFFSTVPSLLRIITSFSYNPSSTNVRRIHCASAPAEEELFTKALDLFPGAKLFNVYGLTELLSWISAYEFTPQNNKHNCVGKIWSGKIKIEDHGEILISSDYQIDHYLENSDSNKFQDEWFKTGDVGFLDDEDRLYLVARIDDVINIGGFKIYPAEIDNIVISSGLAEESMTIGYNINKQTKIFTFVVLKREGDNEIKQFSHFMNNSLELSKRPFQFIYISSLPKTERGKIDKKALREMLMTKFN